MLKKKRYFSRIKGMCLILYFPIYLFCLLNIRRKLFTPQNFVSGFDIIDGKNIQIILCNGGSVKRMFQLGFRGEEFDTRSIS
jgi:hypothetical protein